MLSHHAKITLLSIKGVKRRKKKSDDLRHRAFRAERTSKGFVCPLELASVAPPHLDVRLFVLAFFSSSHFQFHRLFYQLPNNYSLEVVNILSRVIYIGFLRIQ